MDEGSAGDECMLPFVRISNNYDDKTVAFLNKKKQGELAGDFLFGGKSGNVNFKR